MNQILFSNKEEIIHNKDTIFSKSKRTLKLKIVFFFCLIISLTTSSYYFYSLYDKNKNEQISKEIVENFNITNLYSNRDYNAIRTSTVNFYETDNNAFDIIGLIEIPSININYPIISEFNEELLKIAPCRFFGPMPNEIR